MSTPSGFKELYKNCVWTSEEEKTAFFNRYFKNSPMVKDLVSKRTESFKLGLIEFIKENKITENKKERELKMPDVINEIKKDMDESP